MREHAPPCPPAIPWVWLFWGRLLAWERIKRRIYGARQDARAVVFDYIEMFYNPKPQHGFNNQLSRVEFEKRHLLSLESV